MGQLTIVYFCGLGATFHRTKTSLEFQLVRCQVCLLFLDAQLQRGLTMGLSKQWMQIMEQPPIPAH
jgi:hypothetical protein